MRTFYFIRVHHGQADQLPTTVNNDRLTFQTDKFSTYALAYQDAETSNGTANQNQNTSGNSAANANNGKTGSGSSAKTGIDGNDHLSLALAIAGMALVIGGAALAIRRKKDNS